MTVQFGRRLDRWAVSTVQSKGRIERPYTGRLKPGGRNLGSYTLAKYNGAQGMTRSKANAVQIMTGQYPTDYRK